MILRTIKPTLFGLAIILLIGSGRVRGETSGVYTYTINGGAARITAYNGIGGVVSIPSSFNGVPVIGFGTSFKNTAITSITIPGTVTEIEDAAFLGCNYLSSVSIPNSVISIGEFAFDGCRMLTTLTIPNSVTTIGRSAFLVCVNLESIRIPENIETIEVDTFKGCYKLASVTMGNMVTTIKSGAFQFCWDLPTLNLSDSLTNIESLAFSSCNKLTSITIPPGVVNIGDYAFSFCGKLTEVYFEGNAPSLGVYVFYNSFPTIYYIAGTTGWGEVFANRPTSEYVQKSNSAIISSPIASSITYGQTLASSTLSGGSASVAGVFAFTSSETAPGAGIASYEVTFTPSDAATYNTATTSVSVTVSKATPVINTAPTASAITYGQTLASSTLSGGSASVAGNFAWVYPNVSPGVGSFQGVAFTPNDTANYNTVTTSVSVTVNPVSPPPPTGLVITSDLSSVSVNLGAIFSHQITASGSPTSFGAIRLPTGLKLNAKTGLISGKPTRVGIFSATLQALKKGSTTATATKVFTVVQAPTFTYAATINAKKGKALNVAPKIAGYPAPTFSILTGSLPPGMSLNASTAAITGTPTAIGTYPFTVRGSNIAGNIDRSASIVVK
jgi:BspA type Leucine rich repeat region (6 copies)/Putative Ig domain